MQRPATRILSTVVVVWAIALAGVAHAPRESPALAHLVAGTSALNGPPGALAIAAVTSAGADPGRFVSIVAADIDDDGDLDVVASDSSLHLHVWVNDGSGHFTRQRPHKSQAWRADSSASFRVGFTRSESSTRTEPPSLRLAGRSIASVLPPTSRPWGDPGRPLHTTDPSPSGPRAPPSRSI